MLVKFLESRNALAPVLAVCLLAAVIRMPAQDAPTIAPDTSVKAVLRAPLTTKFSRKGDLVSARVLDPKEYQNGLLEGEVHEIKAGGSGGKTASVEFDFHKLHISGKVLAVSMSLVSVANSRHQPSVDEEGTEVETISRKGPEKLVSSVFSRGSAPLRLSVKGSQLSFATGSEFTLEMQNFKAH